MAGGGSIRKPGCGRVSIRRATTEPDMPMLGGRPGVLPGETRVVSSVRSRLGLRSPRRPADRTINSSHLETSDAAALGPSYCCFCLVAHLGTLHAALRSGVEGSLACARDPRVPSHCGSHRRCSRRSTVRAGSGHGACTAAAAQSRGCRDRGREHGHCLVRPCRSDRHSASWPLTSVNRLWESWPHHQDDL